MKYFREELCDAFGVNPDETLFLPEEYFDQCIAGFDSQEGVFVYYSDRVIECLIEHQDMEMEDAMEHFAYNIAGSKGKGYPLYIESVGFTSIFNNLKRREQ